MFHTDIIAISQQLLSRNLFVFKIFVIKDLFCIFRYDLQPNNAILAEETHLPM